MTIGGEDDRKIPLSGLSYLHLLGELGHKYLSTNLITKSLEIKKINLHLYKISSECVIKPGNEAINVSVYMLPWFAG